MPRAKTKPAPAASPEDRLAGFIDAYSPEVAATARAALATLRARLPGSTELVYDNYNALAIAFASSERRSDIILSLTLYPRWASLFFVRGGELPDPTKVLRGSGKAIRHVVLADAEDLDKPPIRALIRAAIEASPKPLERKSPRQTIVKLVAAKRRPRRPA